MVDEEELTKFNKVLLATENNELTARAVSELLSSNITSARMILKRLSDQGKLKKVSEGVDGGGRYFIYSLTSPGLEKVRWLHSIGY